EAPISVATTEHTEYTEKRNPTGAHSPLTTHHSPLTTDPAPLTPHSSPLTAHHSPLTTFEDETRPFSGKERIMILGGGPNRIGQRIECDFCCGQAAFALKAAGYETIMVNSNPETVSTDYDTSDHLFFEPLTAEDVLNICDRMQPKGIIVQFGGQTPLNLARALEAARAPIIGTSADDIAAPADRGPFQ